MLNAQDIVVLAKLVLTPEADVSSVRLASELGMSQAQAYRALRRGEESRIITISTAARGRKSSKKRINRQALYELLTFGVPYVFPAHLGRLERGIPTAGSAPVLAKQFASDPEPVVWPHQEGKVRGMAVQPLHPCVPGAALLDGQLYDLLALIDAGRVGRARERDIARKKLKSLLL